MGKLALAVLIFSFLFVVYSCKEDSPIIPEIKSEEKFEIITPSFEENKVYSKLDHFNYYCELILNNKDTVAIDSVIWDTRLNGSLKGRYQLKAGKYDIICTVYKDSKQFQKIIPIEVTEEIDMKIKNLGQGWEEYSILNEYRSELNHHFYHLDFSSDNQPYLSSDKYGVIYKQNNKWKHYSYADGYSDQAFGINLYHDMIFAGDGGYANLYIFGGDEKWRIFNYSELFGHDGGGTDIHSLEFDDDGKLWIGTHTGYLITFHNRMFEKIQAPKVFHRLDKLIWNNNVLYGIGSRTGVFRYDGAEFKVYQLEDTFETTLCLEVDKDTIWTGGKLGLYKIIDNAVNEVPEDENPFIKSTIYQVMKDSKGYLWIGSRSGISRFDGQKWQNFDKSLFVDDDYFVPRDLKEDKTGNIWFTVQNKLAKFIQN